MLDVFAGAGGLSSGLAQAGFAPVGAVEVSEDAARTYEATHGVDVDRRRLEDIPARELVAMRGRVPVVAGGPPCQPWSTGGLRRGHADDRDGFTAMFRALELIRPQAFVIENVAGLERGRTRPYFLELVAVLRDELGYEVTTRTLNAADFGVPQQRLRMFIVGMRTEGFAFPEPTHGPGRPQPWRTAGDVLTAEPVGEPNPSIVTYAKKPDLRPSPYDGLLFNGGGRPINLDAPARTILASAGGNKTPFVDTLGVVGATTGNCWTGARSAFGAGSCRAHDGSRSPSPPRFSPSPPAPGSTASAARSTRWSATPSRRGSRARWAKRSTALYRLVAMQPGYPHPTSAAVTAQMKGNRRADTKPEQAVRSALHARGLRFRKDHLLPVAAAVRSKADVVFTRARVVVIVDGCFWHSCPEHGRVPSQRPVLAGQARAQPRSATRA